MRTNYQLEHSSELFYSVREEFVSYFSNLGYEVTLTPFADCGAVLSVEGGLEKEVIEKVLEDLRINSLEELKPR